MTPRRPAAWNYYDIDVNMNEACEGFIIQCVAINGDMRAIIGYPDAESIKYKYMLVFKNGDIVEQGSKDTLLQAQIEARKILNRYEYK